MSQDLHNGWNDIYQLVAKFTSRGESDIILCTTSLRAKGKFGFHYAFCLGAPQHAHADFSFHYNLLLDRSL